jgi:hypothetical protein
VGRDVAAAAQNQACSALHRLRTIQCQHDLVAEQRQEARDHLALRAVIFNK